LIVGLKGIIETKEPTLLHVDVQGVVYEVFISLNCSQNINTNNVKLYITHIVREDAQVLYGFLEQDEKIMFEKLIKINGVGPKVAMAICSTYTPASFSNIVQNNDISGLKRVPGIGPKSAGRILVELTGFSITSDENSPTSIAQSQTIMALESLGFKKDIITKTLSTCVSTNTSDLVKEALKKLNK